MRLLAEKRPEAIAGQNCVECHSIETPGIYHDWKASIHAKVDVGCYKCHIAENDQLALKAHLENYKMPVSAVVSPKTCSGCHPQQAEEYDRSKHANTNDIIWEIDLWLNNDMNNSIERTTGCYACHGTVVKVEDGKPIEGTWPNVGVGRINPDNSKGSCSSCHTRHRFSIVEARKPEACGQCHLGPDHPQIEIYFESKHGTLYNAEGPDWNWNPVNEDWEAGKHYRAPTCASCHMSYADGITATHDVTERLSWETQAPRTVRPENFTPYPAATDWQQERNKMKTVCRQCHSTTWAEDHFKNLDEVIRNYNEVYYDPAKKILDELYGDGLASKDKYFDEEIEWQFYELWHHEGRRARMGSAMMAPDYAWWHGFYELKHRFNQISSISEELKKDRSIKIYENFPGQFQPEVDKD
ncbi:multiheme c-type cytochrome [Deltaproteobacteria bacterium]|nr:multiheme c-type cytochrome [Deltaproteobacteria bacterium]